MKPILMTMAALLFFGSLASAQQQNGPPSREDPGGQGQQVAEELRDGIQDAMNRDFLEEQRKQYDAERKTLRDALKAEIEALGRGAKRAQVDAVVRQFKEDHADLIQAQREAADALKEAARDLQEVNRANVPDGRKHLRDLLDKSKASRKQAKDAFKKALDEAKTDEKRREVLDNHIADQRDHHRQVRDDLKKLREEIRNSVVDDDRRPEE